MRDLGTDPHVTDGVVLEEGSSCPPLITTCIESKCSSNPSKSLRRFVHQICYT